MASKGKSGAGAAWLDAAMALLAGGSVAFAVAAMPDYHFGRLVTVSGLPDILAAAQPPLGLTARLGAAGAAGAVAALLVWLLLRLLNRAAKPRKRDAELEEIELAPPRLRRVDSHPDAPARRPLFAGTDLGEPEPEAAAQAAPPAPEPWAGNDTPDPFRHAEEPPADPWQEALEEPEPEPVQAALEELPEPPSEAAGEAIQPDARAERDPQAAPGVRFAAAGGIRSQSEPSLDELVQRLERGARHHPAKPRTAGIDDRLRNALDDLQKMTSRGV